MFNILRGTERLSSRNRICEQETKSNGETILTEFSGKKNFGQRIKFAYKEREGQSKLSFNFNSTTKHSFKFGF